MTKETHTPGPWKHEEDSKWGEAIVAANGEYVVMGNCYSDITVSEEDGMLIAAAPDLLAALEAALEHLEYCNYGDKWERERAEALGLSLTINAAIKKAKGE